MLALPPRERDVGSLQGLSGLNPYFVVGNNNNNNNNNNNKFAESFKKNPACHESRGMLTVAHGIDTTTLAQITVFTIT